MPVTQSPAFGRTRRSPEEIRVDALAAEAYWTSLEQLDAARRTAIMREGTSSDAASLVQTRDTEGSRSDFFGRGTSPLPPPPRLWDGRGADNPEQERRERLLWLERIEHPTHVLLRRLRAEGRTFAQEVAQGGHVQPRYVRGEVHPAGMTYQRALEIAIACLDREAELQGTTASRPVQYSEVLPAPSL